MQILNKAPKVRKVLEKHLEAHFTKECRRLGLLTLKLSVRFSTGWPDRLVASRMGLRLAELKTVDGVLSAKQKLVIGVLKALGIRVPVLRSKSEITEFLESLK